MKRDLAAPALITAILGLVAWTALLPWTLPAHAAATLRVYGDSLGTGWEDWSWGNIQRNMANSTPIHSGSRSIAVTYQEGWCGLQFGQNTEVAIGSADTLRFWVHGGSAGGQQIEFHVGNSCSSVKKTVTPKANTWTPVDVALQDLGKPIRISIMYWFNSTAGAQPTFYLDDVFFYLKGTAPPAAQAGPALSVNAAAGRHAVSPYIYGMSFADEDLAAELKLPLRRWGGNSTTRYNWLKDTSSRASDWFFENIPYTNDPSPLPNGSETDRFVEQDRRTRTKTLLTVPLIGWTPKSRQITCGYSVSKYGAQQEVDPWRPDCGNGVLTGGTLITTNDPLDTSTAITPSFVQQWMSHLIQRYGTSTEGGVRIYNLDNEPMLWNSTHRDVHPLPTSYDEMKERTYAYAAAIKDMDPKALTAGPAVWGWTAYFWSALDWASGDDWWNHPQDRLAHGNVPFIEWYLQQMRDYENKNDRRILDYMDVHFYPQGNGVFSNNAGDSATQALRLRSTRALWDRSYTDESWIATPVYLIPRMREWVVANYPGTRTCIGEYSWGGLCHMNGALAQADILGIFGQENLGMAALWGPPTADQPGAFAFRMYLNYDGKGGKFGNTSVSATSKGRSSLSIYAALRSTDGSLTLMILNKTKRPLTSPVNLSGFAPSGPARVYQYSMDDLTRIVRKPDLTVSSTGFRTTFAPSSMTLVVVPGPRS